MNGYASRKFLITAGAILLTTVLAYFEFMTGPVSVVFAAGIASYNYANMKGHENGQS